MIFANTRFLSGEICTEAGWYRFDGYAGGLPRPRPSPQAADILLGVGDLFPAVRETRRLCYWRLAEGLPATGYVEAS